MVELRSVAEEHACHVHSANVIPVAFEVTAPVVTREVPAPPHFLVMFR